MNPLSVSDVDMSCYRFEGHQFWVHEIGDGSGSCGGEGSILREPGL